MRFKRKVSLLFCVFVTLLFFYLISEEPEQGLGGVGSSSGRHRDEHHNYNQDHRRLQRVEHPENQPQQNSPDQQRHDQNARIVISEKQNVAPGVRVLPGAVNNLQRQPNQPAVQPAVVHPPAPQVPDPREPVAIAKPGVPAQAVHVQPPVNPGNGAVQPPGFPNNPQQNGQPMVGPVFNIGQPNLIFDRSQLRGPAIQQNQPAPNAQPLVQQGQPIARQNVQQGAHIAANNPVVAAINKPQQVQQQVQYRQQPPAQQPQHVPARQPPAVHQARPQQRQQSEPLHQKYMFVHSLQPIRQNVNIFKDGIHLAVVACGDRANETLVMLKSAVLFTKAPIHFHIFAEDELHVIFKENFAKWPPKYQAKITYDIHSITFPPGENAAEWKKLFKPCASQRLFLPDVLTSVDSLLYVDTDVLFLFPLDEIWEFFRRFNDTQLAAMTPEHEALSIGWYNRFAQHPYYGDTGVNSGVMLMNLTRIRKFDWTKRILPIYKEYKLKITWGDQDLLNILFHYHPELLYVYPCEWNYRPDHCMYSSLCKRAEQVGIKVVHGNRRVFHNEKQMTFRSIYEALNQYNLGEDPRVNLLEPMNNALMATTNTPCGKLTDAFLKTLVQSVMNLS